MATYSLSPNASTFAKRLVDDTGLNGNVVAAWIIAETSGNNTTNGPNNWLNVGSFDSGFAGGGANVWEDPTRAADATAAFMLRHAVNGVNPPLGGADPSGGITDIPGTARQSPQAQISAIQRSNWDASHEPNLPSIYSTIVAQGGLGLPAGGGTFGAGGTGTANTSTSTAPWTVGDPSNPDQDYWTAINQYSQNGQLYAFSDAEALYVADGIKLMAQQPAAVIARKDDANVVRAECTYDNTAFQNVATHKKRGKIVRRATLAKVTSPTEVTVRYICPIGKFRAGDVVWLQQFGPADGFWLVGDATRSIFQPYSDLTLVQAMQPINAATATPSTSATTPPTVINPIPGWKLGQDDMGVDAQAPNGTPILAPADCTIISYRTFPASAAAGPSAGSGMQPFVGFKFDQQLSGAQSQNFYVSETFTPTSTQLGTQFKQGQTIGTSATSKLVTGIEIGWANSDGSDTLARASGRAAEGGSHRSGSTQDGSSFRQFFHIPGSPGTN